MTRKLSITTCAAATLLLLSVASCAVQNRASIEFGAICYPTDDCTFSSTCSTVDMGGHLWVDLVTSGNWLVYSIQINNNMPNNADSTTGRTNTNDAYIQGFDITYQASGYSLPNARVLQTLFVPAAGTTVVMVEIIPNFAGAALRTILPAGPTTVMATLKAFGILQDGTSFTTGEYQIPVDVSQGVVGHYACADTTKTIKSICPNDGQSAVVVCE